MTLTAQRSYTEGYTLEDRAETLRILAQQHDESLYRLDTKHDLMPGRDLPCPDHNRCADIFTRGYLNAVAEYADPGLSREDIALYFYELRDAVNALTRYETGNGWDGDDDPEMAMFSDEHVLTLLQTDIDNTLWPLLNGMSPGNVCFWCSRRKEKVTNWNVREAGSSRCKNCQEQGR